MEKHTLCKSCILEIVTALDTSTLFEAVNAFGPTLVMIIGLLIIENRRAAASRALINRLAEPIRKVTGVSIKEEDQPT
jgi:hypothetical protein